MLNRPQRIDPKPGQESVWDYPRPPRLEPVSGRLWIVFNDEVIADTEKAYRVLETSHPPVYYFPPEDIQMEVLKSSPRQTFCEWKGACRYYSVEVGDKQAREAAWYYPNPVPEFAAIAGYVSFYASQMDACYIRDEKVDAQPGDFYGGWITQDIVGPFKGIQGSWGW
ncbi:DUF427 domain-containing protein [Sodalinema gerasimenkoae]|uniref:DUF427 domain-containing protein n=1 Tax=Sodalinema gerasimenkoae TaxID=2862348 RepID=UPI00186588A2|nr:DUF427 domain-containing protein [Sodalinema gerasimenkoae]